MSEQKIFAIWPWHQTTTNYGHKVLISAYQPKAKHPWQGWQLVGDWEMNSWRDSALRCLPEIPPEAREPKPGEIWETDRRTAVVLIECRYGTFWKGWHSGGKSTLESGLYSRADLARLWPESNRTRLHDIRDAIRGQGND